MSVQRARGQREARQEIGDSWEQLLEDESIRGAWRFFYTLYTPERADYYLDWYGIPRPPSRDFRTS